MNRKLAFKKVFDHLYLIKVICTFIFLGVCFNKFASIAALYKRELWLELWK